MTNDENIGAGSSSSSMMLPFNSVPVEHKPAHSHHSDVGGACVGIIIIKLPN
jgi:hypothetical protein